MVMFDRDWGRVGVGFKRITGKVVSGVCFLCGFGAYQPIKSHQSPI